MGDARPVVSITIERGATELEVPARLVVLRSPVAPVAKSLSRGATRLVVSMPLPRRIVATVFIWVVIFAPILFLTYTLFDGPFEPQLAFAFSLFAIGWSSVMYRMGMPSAKREILEVDERFVTVSYDGKLMQLWGRGQLDRMRLNDGPPFLGVARVPAPTIVWGSNIGGSVDYAGGVGAGISREAAARVFEAIESFCGDHPAEPGFDYRGSGTMFG